MRNSETNAVRNTKIGMLKTYTSREALETLLSSNSHT